MIVFLKLCYLTASRDSFTDFKTSPDVGEGKYYDLWCTHGHWRFKILYCGSTYHDMRYRCKTATFILNAEHLEKRKLLHVFTTSIYRKRNSKPQHSTTELVLSYINTTCYVFAVIHLIIFINHLCLFEIEFQRIELFLKISVSSYFGFRVVVFFIIIYKFGGRVV